MKETDGKAAAEKPARPGASSFAAFCRAQAGDLSTAGQLSDAGTAECVTMVFGTSTRKKIRLKEHLFKVHEEGAGEARRLQQVQHGSRMQRYFRDAVAPPRAPRLGALLHHRHIRVQRPRQRCFHLRWFSKKNHRRSLSECCKFE